MFINKATNGDLQRYLNEALRSKYKGKYVWVQDFTDTEVYFNLESSDDGYYTSKTYKLSYTTSGVDITLTGEAVEVVMESKYTEVSNQEPITEKSLIKAIKSTFKDLLGLDKYDKNDPSRIVLKRFQEEQMISIEPLYVAPDISDLEGDAMDRETIENMVKSANKALEAGKLASNIDHKQNVDWFSIKKIWVNPCPCTISGINVDEGQPLAEIKFHDVEKWEARKSGGILGLSIGAKCTGFREVTDE